MQTLTLVLLAATCITGCSTEAWYESAKRNAELRCQGLPQAAYDDCMARVNQKSYQEYKKEASGNSSSGN